MWKDKDIICKHTYIYKHNIQTKSIDSNSVIESY